MTQTDAEAPRRPIRAHIGHPLDKLFRKGAIDVSHLAAGRACERAARHLREGQQRIIGSFEPGVEYHADLRAWLMGVRERVVAAGGPDAWAIFSAIVLQGHHVRSPELQKFNARKVRRLLILALDQVGQPPPENTH